MNVCRYWNHWVIETGFYDLIIFIKQGVNDDVVRTVCVINFRRRKINLYWSLVIKIITFIEMIFRILLNVLCLRPISKFSCFFLLDFMIFVYLNFEQEIQKNLWKSLLWETYGWSLYWKQNWVTNYTIDLIKQNNPFALLLLLKGKKKNTRTPSGYFQNMGM